jgi:hypothetical protein
MLVKFIEQMSGKKDQLNSYQVLAINIFSPYTNSKRLKPAYLFNIKKSGILKLRMDTLEQLSFLRKDKVKFRRHS